MEKSAKEIGREIKKLLNKAGVKSSISSRYGWVNVSLKSHASDSVIVQIKKLSTRESHGDSMNDTQYFTGVYIYLTCDFERNEAAQ